MTGFVNPKFWKGKKVFLTGHTGFKGSWLSLWLQLMGSEVKGYSLKPLTTPSLFNIAKISNEMESEFGDIRDLSAISRSMKKFNPDIMIHMAAQPLVRLSYESPVETYATNVMGTVNVLEAAKGCENLQSIVNVTTDKCYENKEWHWGYRENEAMGGHDPYSSSKGCSELVTTAYRKSFFYKKDSASLASARAGNVIGGGDWAQDRLIPDILRAFNLDKPVLVRNPKSTRPWQHVLEPLSGYLVLSEKLFLEGSGFAESWNFGPNEEDVKSVSYILDYIVNNWGNKVEWKTDTKEQPHEAQLLKLDISKAKAKLGWEPKWSLHEALDSIINWNSSFRSKEDMKQVTINQINQFLS